MQSLSEVSYSAISNNVNISWQTDYLKKYFSEIVSHISLIKFSSYALEKIEPNGIASGFVSELTKKPRTQTYLYIEIRDALV